MTNPEAPVGELPATPPDRFLVLPHARAGGISGLLEIVDDHGGREQLPKLAESLRLEVDDLLPAVDASSLLGFATVEQGDVILTKIGKEFATGDIPRSHAIFKDRLLKVSFVSTGVEAIRQKRDGRIKEEFMLDILDDHFSPPEAESQFETLVDWGRYAHLFDFDADQERLHAAGGDEVLRGQQLAHK
jgi:NitT/TauT family transport system ATP-binding protein